MIRKNPISTLLALLLISAMTLADTSTWVFELDEIIESTEIENEELKEGSGVEREWHKLLTSGDSNFLPSGLFRFKSVILHLLAVLNIHDQASLATLGLPLFILHCSLKVHLG